LYYSNIFIYLYQQVQTTKTNKMNKATNYKIEVLNGGKLFCVSDDYNMYGSYYKTRKGAEKQLDKVLKMTGAK